MFHNPKLNYYINRIHEGALTIVYQKHNSQFDELSANDGFFRFNDRNLQKLLIEIWSLKLAPEIVNEVFASKECPYRFFFLRSKPRNIRSVMYGIETAAAVGSRIWSSMPSELKESTSRNEFRLKIKIFTIFIGNCPC